MDVLLLVVDFLGNVVLFVPFFHGSVFLVPFCGVCLKGFHS